MESLISLFDALLQLARSLFDLLLALVVLVRPWLPLLGWIALWLFAADWTRLREVLSRGGWVGVVLVAAVAVLVWGSVAPGSGSYDFLGLKVSNFVEKTVYVSGLVCIMFLAGALQLSGCCASWCQFEEPAPPAGHDDHHGADGGGHQGAAHSPNH